MREKYTLFCVIKATQALFSVFGVAVLTVIPMPAHAAPTYLNCNYIRDDGVSIAIKITVDEARQTVVDDLGGAPVRHSAIFTGDVVTWEYEALPHWNVAYALDRVSLRLTRASEMFGNPAATEGGACIITKIAHPSPKRAF